MFSHQQQNMTLCVCGSLWLWQSEPPSMCMLPHMCDSLLLCWDLWNDEQLTFVLSPITLWELNVLLDRSHRMDGQLAAAWLLISLACWPCFPKLPTTNYNQFLIAMKTGEADKCVNPGMCPERNTLLRVLLSCQLSWEQHLYTFINLLLTVYSYEHFPL